MKISLECKDLIIKKALELFLKEHLVMKKDCGFVISDEKVSTQKPLSIIVKNSPFLSLPFSGGALMNSLSEFDSVLKITTQKLADEKKRVLEVRIDKIASGLKRDYQSKIDLTISELKDKLVKALTYE